MSEIRAYNKMKTYCIVLSQNFDIKAEKQNYHLTQFHKKKYNRQLKSNYGLITNNNCQRQNSNRNLNNSDK